MNDLEAAIYQVLSNDDELQELTEGRIYPVQPPINPPFPFLLFAVNGVSGDERTPMSGANVIRPWMLNIDVMATNIGDVTQIANRLQDLLQSYSDDDIRGIFFQSKQDNQEMNADGEIYNHTTQTFKAWF